MNISRPQTIDEIITELDQIILENKTVNSCLGYFTALYRKVTVKVKEGIASGYFDDGKRMEELDVIFANRYLDAYHAFRNDLPVTDSWQKAFEASGSYWPIVLQHLLIGMNAHINLDLGIAAAEVSKDTDISELENDFNKINDLLASLVDEVQNELANIWPTLKKLLKMTKGVDDFFVNFSMKVARDGAWKFAKSLTQISHIKLEDAIAQRDQKVAKNSKIIFSKNPIVQFIFGIIRIKEKGTVNEKINVLAN